MSAQTLAPVVYTLSAPAPATQTAEITARFPSGGQASIELMMPRWTPGAYVIEDHASQVVRISATAGGQQAPVEKTATNRWRVQTRGAVIVVVSYAIRCAKRSPTTNWVSPQVGVFNGAATFITLAERVRRPHEVHVESRPAWRSVASALDRAPDGVVNHYRAASYDELVDSPIIAGDLSIHDFEMAGKLHMLVDAGDRPASWDPQRIMDDLVWVVRAPERFFGEVPYSRYYFFNVFGQPAGAMGHRASTLAFSAPDIATSGEAYQTWLRASAKEYFHAYNLRRLRPMELGPFDYELPPRISTLWIVEGVTEYYADLMLARARLSSVDELLAAFSARIARLQSSPGRLVQTLQQSSLAAWDPRGPPERTVDYAVKGAVVAMLLDARIRQLTRDTRSLDHAMHLAYIRYGGERGFTDAQFRAVAEEAAGATLGDFFQRATASVAELDFQQFLDWYGLRFGTPGRPDRAWELEARANASAEQRAHLAALIRW